MLALLTLCLSALGLLGLFADMAWPTVIPILLPLLAGAWVWGMLAGMGQPRPALALATAATITLVLGHIPTATVVFAAAAGAAWGPPRTPSPFLCATLMAIAVLGTLATLAPDTAFSPALAAGLSSLLLALFACMRMPTMAAMGVGAATGFCWALGGFGGTGIAAALFIALIGATARRIPMRTWMLAGGMAMGAGCGTAVAWLTGAVVPANPTPAGAVAILSIALAMGAAISAGGLRHSHAYAALAAALLAASSAPAAAAVGLSMLALVAGALCAPRRASLFAPSQQVDTAAQGPAFPWLRKAWTGAIHHPILSRPKPLPSHTHRP